MAKAVKLADIAAKFGVSVVTVSKALSGQKGVSEELREQIIDYAKELGYVQPSAARRMALPGSFHIGVLIRDVYLERYSSFYWQMYQSIAQAATGVDCFTMLEVVTRDMEKKGDFPKMVLEQKIDGIIVVGHLQDDYLARLMKELTLPVVFMDFMDKNQQVDSVISDNYYGAYYMTNYLFDQGHKDIAFVGTKEATGSIADRFLGYRRALMDHKQAYRPDWVIDDRDPETGNIDEDRYLQLPKEMPTAFFCNCDLTAGHLIRKLNRLGYRVPEDISVAGYDNYIFPGLCDVAITSYEVDFAQMAERTLKTLLKKLTGEKTTGGIHIVEGHLVIKDSVQRIASVNTGKK